MKQYVYKVALTAIKEPSLDKKNQAKFHLYQGIMPFFFAPTLFIKRFGLSFNLLKLLLKLLLKKNALYVVVYNKNIVSDGLISYAHCKHYQVSAADVIIGPVNTSGNFQGKGFATFGLASSLQALKSLNNYHSVFIDTREDNIAMQTVIKKCGFGEHIETFERDANYH